MKFDVDKITLSDPNQYPDVWSKVNAVKIAKAYWTHSQLILSLVSLADALTLWKKPLVFLNGRKGVVE